MVKRIIILIFVINNRKIKQNKMAKKKVSRGYIEVFADVQSVFDDVIIKYGIDKMLTVKVLALDGQKKIFVTSKASTREKHESGVDIYIVINQRIFEGLTEAQKILQVEEALAGVTSDGKVTKGDITTHSGILRKYGYDESKKGGNTSYEVLQETIKSLYTKASEEDNERNKD